MSVDLAKRRRKSRRAILLWGSFAHYIVWGLSPVAINQASTKCRWRHSPIILCPSSCKLSAKPPIWYDLRNWTQLFFWPDKSSKLRILPQQNTALLSHVCPSVTGVTSHLFTFITLLDPANHIFSESLWQPPSTDHFVTTWWPWITRITKSKHDKCRIRTVYSV